MNKKELEKTALDFGPGGRTFTLGNGQTPMHAVRVWNRTNPGRKISLKALLEANPGIDPRRYKAGVQYKMPSSAVERNNPGNVRFYGQKWKGEIPDGLSKGDFSVFVDPWYGGRAAVRTLMNMSKKMESPTILKLIESYSPPGENDTYGHSKNISKEIGIPEGQFLDTNDTGKWVDFARGLFKYETGDRYRFSPQDMTNMVLSARQSL